MNRDGAPPQPPDHRESSAVTSPFVLERLLREAHLAADADETAVVPGANIELHAWQTGRTESLRDNPAEQAQELAYQAMESDDSQRAGELARQALNLDAGCVDALVVQALVTAETSDDLLAQLEHAVRVAEDALGEEFLAEYMGDLHAEVIARPYLRALRQLADAQWEAGRRLDGVALLENLLELDQSDHDGHAVVLLACYLEMGEVHRARLLVDEQGADDDALFQWAAALVAYLEGSYAAAEAALARARQLNAGAVPYLTGEREPPLEYEPFYTPGEESEAVVIGQVLAPAWAAHSAALLWLLASDEENEDAAEDATEDDA